MSLLDCQTDAYQWTSDATVVSCEEVENGHCDVVLDGGVLYPEGGGQPADHGTIAGVAVVDVQRRDDGQVVARVTGRVAEGSVTVTVDGVRRFDHMQQHTAQHLITAVAQDRFGLATTSFHLGAGVCSIDLDGPLSNADRIALEAAVNTEIRIHRPVRHKTVTVEQYGALDVRSRGLPAGHTGLVRLIEIDGLDRNTCGGTHVAHLGELQAIHLLGVEKARGGVRLSYLAGGRVLDRLRGDTQRSGDLTQVLKCGAPDHVGAVKRILDDNKAAARQRKGLLKELGALLGAALRTDPGPIVHLHRDEADLGFLRTISNAASRGGPPVLLLTGGEANGPGVFLLVAPSPVIAEVGAAVAAALSARGGGRGTTFQGKADNLGGLAQALAVLRTADLGVG